MTPHVPPPAGSTRAAGMLLQYTVPGAEAAAQLRLAAGEDAHGSKRQAAAWLAAMHKVRQGGEAELIDVFTKRLPHVWGAPACSEAHRPGTNPALWCSQATKLLYESRDQ